MRKRTNIIAAMALAFVLGVFVPVTTVLTSVPSVYADSGESDALTNFKAALETGEGAVKLEGNITLDGVISINRNVDIDLDGHTITIADTTSRFNVARHEVTFRNGTISSNQNGSNVLIALTGSATADGSKTNVTLEKDLTIEATGTRFAVGIFEGGDNASHGVSFTLKGTMNAKMGISINGTVKNDTATAPVVTIAEGAKINAPLIAIYAAGNGKWNIEKDAEIITGNAIGMKSGELTVTDATIHMTDVDCSSSDTSCEAVEGADFMIPKTSTSGISVFGSVFQIEHNKPPYAGGVKITINGGTYTSDQGPVFLEYGNDTDNDADITINGGAFVSTSKEIFRYVRDGKTGPSVAVNGVSTFKGTDVAEFEEIIKVANGYESSTADGVLTVSRTQTSGGSTGGGTNNPSDDKEVTIPSDDESVTVTGELPKDVKVTVGKSDKKVAAFGDVNYQVFDINLMQNGVKYNLNGKVTVTIKVPEGINGAKSSIYYVKDNGAAERIKNSAYRNGYIAFETTHFSLYAIVEDDGVDLTMSTPDTGFLAFLGSEAKTTVVATSAVILIAAGAGVVAYRGSRRSARK